MFHRLGSLKTVVRGLEKEGGTQVGWNKVVCREVNGNYLGRVYYRIYYRIYRRSYTRGLIM
jgi:hypothetical protein